MRRDGLRTQLDDYLLFYLPSSNRFHLKAPLAVAKSHQNNKNYLLDTSHHTRQKALITLVTLLSHGCADQLVPGN